jgi:hypothetical protein
LLIPDRSATAIAATMRLLADEAALRDATAVVREFWYRPAVVQVWGEGTFAAAAAMRLDASRPRWHARVAPRRRTYGSGISSHVLAPWGIMDDQPWV